MKKPEIKREVAIRTYSVKDGMVSFDASREAASDLAEFGKVCKVAEDVGEGGNQYLLFIDSRFDYTEVIEYIKNYG